MNDRLPIYYWDTCILLERVKGENITPSKRRAIQQLLDDNKNEKNRIVTSVLTHAEAIPRKITVNDSSAEVEYWAYFDGIFFLDQEITRPIINLARHLRDFYYKEADLKTATPYRMLGLGDSIHLASAIVAEADEFHTRDKRPSGGNLGLLTLPSLHPNGLIGGTWKLKIVSPEDAQTNLLDSTVQGVA
jgi:hypothetical protein